MQVKHLPVNQVSRFIILILWLNKFMSFWFELLTKKPNSNLGFTLIELIAASIMTVFVVGAVGYGLIVMLREQTVTAASGDIQSNLNRAVDFMAEEVKSANNIMTDVSASNLTTNAGSFTQSPAVKKVILVLQVPGVSERIIYYSQTSSSPWLSPNVIRRWGPDFGSDGSYSNPTSPGSWDGEVLVDSIDNTLRPVSCPTGKTSPNPASGDTINGFYVCVDSTGKLVEISAFATAAGDQKIQNIAGTNPDENTRYGNRVTYSSTTQVYARSAP